MFSLFKLINSTQPELREFDPTTLQRLKEGAYLTKLISEAEVAARKCEFYAGNCHDDKVKDFFANEVQVLNKAKHVLQEYYSSMTKE